MKPTTVIFDFDGTIADTFQIGVDMVNQLASEFGFEQVTDANRESLRAGTMRQAMRALHVPLWKVGKIAARGRELFTQVADTVQPCSGMVSVLRDLHTHGYRLGIVTLNTSNHVNAFLERNDLQIFDFVSSGKRAFQKHRVFKKVLRGHQLDAQQVVYVGDEVRDIVAAKKAHIPIIAVSWGFNTQAILQQYKPDYFAATPSELFKLLEMEYGYDVT